MKLPRWRRDHDEHTPAAAGSTRTRGRPRRGARGDGGRRTHAGLDATAPRRRTTRDRDSPVRGATGRQPGEIPIRQGAPSLSPRHGPLSAGVAIRHRDLQTSSVIRNRDWVRGNPANEALPSPVSPRHRVPPSQWICGSVGNPVCRARNRRRTAPRGGALAVPGGGGRRAVPRSAPRRPPRPTIARVRTPLLAETGAATQALEGSDHGIRAADP
jgi:hypothetical protein